MSTWKIVVAGLVVNSIVFISVFDIYFTSLFIEGLPAYASPLPAPAKRLIFIVADGLRADKTFMLQSHGRSAARYLRNIGETEGTWGVSIAGVPTATRPGHVAMTAGFYEDPTSVVKDINHAEIRFDTVFKEARYTWTWDTPKFLEQVATDHPDRIFSKQFPGDRKYLSGIDPKEMDSWVFDEVSTFIRNAKHDATLKEKMNKDKLLFFVHLGGIDHAGYIVRPNSQRYLEHLAFLDEGIKDIVEQFEDFFDHDKKTTYVFTSDHGMTNWGAHGEGLPDEIQCPLIVWGAGIRHALPEDDLSRYNDTLSQDWSLTEWKRADIEQPSLAPLMAAAIGITFPRNAIYPIPDGFFDIPEEEMFEIFYANLKQLFDNYLAIERYIHTGPLAFNFRSYRPLTGLLIKSLKMDIEAQKEAGNYAMALKLTKEKAKLVFQGIQHYRLYSKVPLWLATFSSLVGWMCFCALILIQQYQNWEDISVPTPIMSNTKHIIIQCAVGLLVFDLIFLYAQSTPTSQCMQFLMPIPIWTACILKWHDIGSVLRIIKRQKELAPILIVSAIGLILVIVSMYHRYIMGLLMITYPLTYLYFGGKDLDKSLFKQWMFSFVGIAILAGKPTGDREIHYNLVLFSGMVAITVALLYHLEMGDSVKGRLCRSFGRRFAAYQILKLAFATCVVCYSSYLTQNDIRTPPSVQISSWVVLFVSLLEPLLVNTDIQSRLVAISFGFAAPYILLSISQETLCYFFLIWNHYIFVEIESRLTKSQPIFLPRTTHEATNRVANSSVSNGKSFSKGHSTVKHHKHTKSNEYLMWQPTLSEWQNLDFASASESDIQCKRMMTTGDIRRVLYFHVIGLASMYGTGLVPAINSFDVQDVFCFITVSNPPRMGALVMVKFLIPCFVTACFLSATNKITFTSVKNFTVTLFLFAAFMTTIFFTLVTNIGTWTVIGASVSHFLISAGIGMYFCLQVGVVYVITTVKFSFVFGACFKLLARRVLKLQSFL